MTEAELDSGPLAQVPLFSRLDEAAREALLDHMEERACAANQCVFWMGDKGDDLYLIQTGRVAITVPNDRGEHIALDSLDPGGFFGEISLLDGGPRSATVRAIEDSTFLVLSRDAFHQFLRTRPESAIAILNVMGHRQRVSTAALRSMQNPNVAFDERRVNWWQKTSDTIAAVAASQYFTLVHIAWFGLWIGLNVVGMLMDAPPKWLSWDPYPFGLLTMVVSLEAIFLSIFVMVSQNRQSEKDRLRTDLDYQVNVKAQTEIIEIARRLERLETRLVALPEAAAAEIETLLEEREEDQEKKETA